MTNGRAKGAAGERELAAVLRDWGYTARRGQQYSGANGDADVVSSIPGLHIECKRVERLNITKAYEQAIRDAAIHGLGVFPVVMHRCNRTPWLVTLSLDDFLAVIGSSDDLE